MFSVSELLKNVHFFMSKFFIVALVNLRGAVSRFLQACLSIIEFRSGVAFSQIIFG